MTVITRFAPSPTGTLHTGSARTALYNYLFSKKNGGKYLLRIEDTDIVRSSEEHTEQIRLDLIWLGLHHDGEIVYQRTRIARHTEVAHELLAKGNAYKCFATQEEIEAFRTANPNAKFQSPWRDRADHPSTPFVIRLKAPREGSTIVNDLIQGKIEVQNSELDDMVLLRSDGTPTYMLAVVVDDFDMKITHIIRGDDHLTNAFRQKQIYEAMGWKVPEFAHIPLIHDKEGKKLSKRKGAISIAEYKRLGYLPEAVCNHLLRLGWSHGDDEIITMLQAEMWFDLEHVGKSPAKFDQDKLNFINSQYIKNTANESLFDLLVGFNPKITKHKARILKGLDGLKPRATTLVDLAAACNIYIAKNTELDEKSHQTLASGGKELLEEFSKVLHKHQDWTKDSLQKLGEEFMASKGQKPSLLMMALRAGVLGTFNAPGVYEVMEVLGKDEVLERLGILSC